MLMRKKRIGLLVGASYAALFGGGVIAPPSGGMLLLAGETDGMATDFTVADGLGSVAVLDTVTPANDKNNVSGDSFWNNAGTSPKLVSNSSGVLGWSPHNICLQSDTFSSATWTNFIGGVGSTPTRTADFAADPVTGLTTADRIQLALNGGTTTADRSGITAGTVTGIVGATHTVSVYAKLNTGTTAAVRLGINGSSNATNVTVTNVWQQFTFTDVLTSATSDFRIYLIGGTGTADSADLVLARAQNNRGTTPTTYLATTTAARYGLGIDYNQGAYGLLVEPAATNLIVRSQEIDNTTSAWIHNGTPVVTANATTAPDGSLTADKLASVNLGTSSISQSINVTSGSSYTCSIHAKASEWGWLRIGFNTLGFPDAGRAAWFDLTNGVTGTVQTGVTALIVALANGWYRCSISAVADATASGEPFFTPTNADNTTANGDGTSGIFLWGAQYETGTVATSHIPTFAATVTRATDDITKLVSAMPFSATEGSFLVDAAARVITGTTAVNAFHVDAGSTNDLYAIDYVDATPANRWNVLVAGGVQAQIAHPIALANGYRKTAGTYKLNDFRSAQDGVLGTPDVAGTLPTVTTFRLGQRITDRRLNGWIRQIVYLPRAYTNAELQTKTAPAVLLGASLLLTSEPNGMASDFTHSSGQGQVSVFDQFSPGNAKINVIADSWWTQAGTSPKLIKTSAGALAWSPHNMALQSQAFENAAWSVASVTITANQTAAPDGTTTADKFTDDGTPTSKLIVASSIAVVSGATYTVTIRMKHSDIQWMRIMLTDDASATNGGQAWFDIQNGVVGTVSNRGTGWTVGTATITSLGNGWYEAALPVTAGGITAYIWVLSATADASSTRDAGNTFLWGAQVNRGTVPTTYLATTTAARYGLGIDYANGSYGLLVEPAATNIQPASQDFSNITWTNTDLTVTPDNIAAPDGTTTADLVTYGVAGTGQTRSTLTITANTTYTFSVFAKKGNNDWLRLAMVDQGASANFVRGWYNLGSGVVGSFINGGTGTGATGTITALANGWYRVTLTGAVNNATVTQNQFIVLQDADASITRVNGSTAYLWGAQLETGTVASSPIPTFAATVTRAADGVFKALTALPFSTTEGTAYIQMADTLGANGRPYTFGLAAESDVNVIQFSTVAGSTTLSARILASSVTQASFTNTIAANVAFQHTLAWKVNDFARSFDGAAVSTDISGSIPVGLDRLAFARGNLTQVPSVHVRKFIYVPRRVIDAELPTWKYVP